MNLLLQTLMLMLELTLDLDLELELIILLNATPIQILENQVEYTWKIKKKARKKVRKEIIKKVRRKVMGRFEKRTILTEAAREYQWEEAMRLSQLNLDV